MRRAAAKTIRTMPGQQFVENNAQRVNVGEEGDGFALYLFGAGVFHRHHAQGRRGLRRGLGDKLWVEQFGDAEIEQLR